jgi:hypothetical protein
MDHQTLERLVEQRELETLTTLHVEECLREATSTRAGMSRFAEAFHFCRIGFVRMNFLLGARCPDDERYWVGIANNLWAESGGGVTLPHNTLYRRFLKWASGKDSRELVSPDFATKFNDEWDRVALNYPVKDALVTLAAYEAMDKCDYQMLYRALATNCDDPSAMEFFEVHTEVEHTEQFCSVFNLVSADEVQHGIYESSIDLSVSLQRDMWRGLLTHLGYQG